MAEESRFSGLAFVPADYGTMRERERRMAVAYAFDEADKGNYEPGIALGIFPADAGKEKEK